MKKLFLVTFCFVTAILVHANTVYSTHTDFPQFEEIASPDFPQMKFLVDKINGTVWQYGVNNKGMSYWDELFVQTFDYYVKNNPEACDSINYQIVIGDPMMNSCYLANIHTGQRWNFTFDNTLGLYILLIDKETKTVKIILE